MDTKHIDARVKLVSFEKFFVSESCSLYNQSQEPRTKCRARGQHTEAIAILSTTTILFSFCIVKERVVGLFTLYPKGSGRGHFHICFGATSSLVQLYNMSAQGGSVTLCTRRAYTKRSIITRFHFHLSTFM